ncbi:MAG: hypothetical protein M3021_06605, partial [Actinomycetota bacterium]|nr:hypothetical protein [Actinomycetota bacterium]
LTVGGATLEAPEILPVADHNTSTGYQFTDPSQIGLCTPEAAPHALTTSFPGPLPEGCRTPAGTYQDPQPEPLPLRAE